MELTKQQRAELEVMRDHARIEATHAYTRDARPAGGKVGYKALSRKLDAFARAWNELDGQLQEHLLVAAVRAWNSDDAVALPDLARIANQLRDELKLPAHAEEKNPGLMAAAKYMWRLWIADKADPAPIRSGAMEIGEELAPLFEVTVEEAQRSVEQILRDWDKGKMIDGVPFSDMPGRGTGRAYRDGIRVS